MRLRTPPAPANPPAEVSARLQTEVGPVPLGFAEDDRFVYLVARDRGAKWPIGVLRAGWAEVSLPSGPATGDVALVTDEAEQTAILERFRTKYGAAAFARWYEKPARILRVRRGGGVPGPDDQRYFRWLEAEFDGVAEHYDHHISSNRMNRLLRDRSLAMLRPMFAGTSPLIEIGCGSGMETLTMLRDGREILAVDISDRMLEVVRRKAKAEGMSERLRTRRIRAGDLGQLVDELGEGSLRGGYSTYGALNCEPDLSGVPPALHRLLAPGSHFVVGMFNRWCLFEMVGYTITFQNHRAFGRRFRPVPVGTSRFCIDTYAYSVGDFRKLFGDRFDIGRVEGVPVLLPPSDLTSYSERFSRRFEQLARIDAWTGRRWPFNRLGDHFLMELIRRPDRPPAAG